MLSFLGKGHSLILGITSGILFTVLFSILEEANDLSASTNIAASYANPQGGLVCPDCSVPCMPRSVAMAMSSPLLTQNCDCPTQQVRTTTAQDCPPPRECPPCTATTKKSTDEKSKRSPTVPIVNSPVVLTTTAKGTPSYLGIVQPIVPLQERDGLVKMPKGTKHLCLDIGASLYSPSSKYWWRDGDENTFIIAFEPNIFSYSLLKYTSHPVVAHNPNQWFLFNPECHIVNGSDVRTQFQQWWANCIYVSYGHISNITRRPKFFPINAAVSNVDGFATFNLGVGDPGVGSLYEFKGGTQWATATEQVWGHSHVPKIRLATLLPFLPSDIPWEVAKIDAQGHDAEVVDGLQDYLTKFKCVVGEFDTRAYAGADQKSFSYRNVFKKKGFIPVTFDPNNRKTRDNFLFLNTRFGTAFRQHKYMCTANDFKPPHVRIVETLDAAKVP